MRKLLKVLCVALLMLPLLGGCNEANGVLESFNLKMQAWLDVPPKLDRASLPQPIIEVSGSTLLLDGKPLHFKRTVEEWTKILGADYRDDPDDSRKDTRTWDKAGLVVYLDHQNTAVSGHIRSKTINSVVSLVVHLQQDALEDWQRVPFDTGEKPAAPKFDPLPRGTFRGSLIINGALFNAKTSVKQLNSQLKEKERFERRNSKLFSAMSPNQSDAEAISLVVRSPTGYEGIPAQIAISTPKQ